MSVIPLYVYTIVCLSIHQLTDICIVSTFELLQIMPLWTSASISLDRSVGVELLGHLENMFKFLQIHEIVFQNGYTTFHSHQ